MVIVTGFFYLQKISATSSIRGSRGTPGSLKDRERYGTGDKNNKDEKSVNGTQIFHWEVSIGKRDYLFTALVHHVLL